MVVRWRTTGVLFLVLFVLLGVAYYVGTQGEDVPTTATELPPVLDFDLASVSQVTAKQGDREITLVWDGAAWRIQGEEMADADTDEVSMRLRSLLNTVAFDAFEPAQGLAEYGLAQPSARLIFSVDGRTVTLLVGDATPAGSDYFVQVEGNPTVYVISKYLVDRILEWASSPPYPPTPTPTPA